MLGGKGAPCSDPGWQGPTEDTTGKKETELRLEPREIGPVWNYIFKRIIPGRQILFLRCKVLGCKSATKFCFPDSRGNSGICPSTEFFPSQGLYFLWLCANQVSKARNGLLYGLYSQAWHGFEILLYDKAWLGPK